MIKAGIWIIFYTKGHRKFQHKKAVHSITVPSNGCITAGKHIFQIGLSDLKHNGKNKKRNPLLATFYYTLEKYVTYEVILFRSGLTLIDQIKLLVVLRATVGSFFCFLGQVLFLLFSMSPPEVVPAADRYPEDTSTPLIKPSSPEKASESAE